MVSVFFHFYFDVMFDLVIDALITFNVSYRLSIAEHINMFILKYGGIRYGAISACMPVEEYLIGGIDYNRVVIWFTELVPVEC